MKEVENNAAAVNEKKKIVSIDSFFNLRNLFGQNMDFRDFKKHGPIPDDNTFNNNMLLLFAVYLLAEKDVSMEQLRDMFTKGNTQGIRQLTEAFIHDVTSRPVRNTDDLFEEERIMNYRWYGRMYHKAMEKATNLGYTFADKGTFNNAEALQNLVESPQKQVYRYCYAFQTRPYIFKSSKNNAYKEGYKHFIEGFGGRQTYDDDQNKAYVIGVKSDIYFRRTNGNKNFTNSLLYLLMEYDDHLNGINSRDISREDYQTYLTYYHGFMNVDKKALNTIQKSFTSEEQSLIIDHSGSVSTLPDDLRKKFILAGAELFPFVTNLVKEAREYGYKDKDETERQKKIREAFENTGKDKEAQEKKLAEEAELRKKYESEEEVWKKEIPVRRAEQEYQKKVTAYLDDQKFRSNFTGRYENLTIPQVQSAYDQLKKEFKKAPGSERAEAELSVLGQYLKERSEGLENRKKEYEAAYREAENKEELSVKLFLKDFIGEEEQRGFLHAIKNAYPDADIDADEMKSDWENITKDPATRDEKARKYFLELAAMYPKSWEYNKESRETLPTEIRNSGNHDALVRYFNKNQANMHICEKARILHRIRTLEKAQNIYNGDRNKEKDSFIDRPYVIISQNPGFRDEHLNLGNRQSSNNGCWSCALELQLKAQGISVTQEEIRNFRVDFDDKKLHSPSFTQKLDRVYMYDNMNDITEKSSAALAFKPNLMMRTFDILTPDQAQEALGTNGLIDRQKYIKDAANSALAKIKYILLNDNSPVSFTDGRHYYTITGIDGPDVTYIDSMRKGDVNVREQKPFENFVRDIMMPDPQSGRLPNKLQLVWLTEMELSEDGRSFYNVPSNYLELKEDGSFKMPPQAILDDATDKTATEDDSFRLCLVGGKDDTVFDRLTRNPLDDKNLFIVEQAIIPKKINADLLRANMKARSEDRRNELEQYRKDLLGKETAVSMDDFEIGQRGGLRLQDDEKPAPIPRRTREAEDRKENDDKTLHAVKTTIRDRKLSRDQKLAVLTEYREANGLFKLGKAEQVDAKENELLIYKAGAIAAFRLKLVYDNAMRVFDYLDTVEGKAGYREKINKVTADYKKLMAKLDLPENAIQGEVRPHIYQLNGYFKKDEDILAAIHMADSIGDELPLKDFHSERRKIAEKNDRLYEYDPSVLARCVENIKEFADREVKVNILKTCSENPDYHQAVKDSLILPSRNQDILNMTEKNVQSASTKKYFEMSVLLQNSYDKGTKESVDAAVSAQKELTTALNNPEAKRSMPLVRNAHIVNREIEKDEKQRILSIEDPDLLQVRKAADQAKHNAAHDHVRNIGLGAIHFRDFTDYPGATRENLKNAGFQSNLTDQKIMDNMVIYAMGVMNMTPAEIVNASPEKKKEIGNRFASDIQKHKFYGSSAQYLSEEEFRENMKWYGEMYRRAHDMFMGLDLRIPDIDQLKDPQKAEEYVKSPSYMPSSLLAALIYPTEGSTLFEEYQGSYNPTSQSRMELFREGYGPVSEYEDRCRNLRAMNLVNTVAEMIANPEVSDVDKIFFKYMLELDLIAKKGGQKVGEVFPPNSGKDKDHSNLRTYLRNMNAMSDNINALFEGFSDEEITVLKNSSFKEVAVSNPELAKRVLDTMCLEGNVSAFQKLQEEMMTKAHGEDYAKELQAKFAPPVPKKDNPKQEEPVKIEEKSEEPSGKKDEPEKAVPPVKGGKKDEASGKEEKIEEKEDSFDEIITTSKKDGGDDVIRPDNPKKTVPKKSGKKNPANDIIMIEEENNNEIIDHGEDLNLRIINDYSSALGLFSTNRIFTSKESKKHSTLRKYAEKMQARRRQAQVMGESELHDTLGTYFLSKGDPEDQRQFAKNWLINAYEMKYHADIYLDNRNPWTFAGIDRYDGAKKLQKLAHYEVHYCEKKISALGDDAENGINLTSLHRDIASSKHEEAMEKLLDTDFSNQTVEEKTRSATTMAEALASLVAGYVLESGGKDPKVVNHYTVLDKICKGVFLAQAIINIVQSKPSRETLEALFDPKNMNNNKGIKHYLQQRNINLFDEFVPKPPAVKTAGVRAKRK